MPGAHWYMPGRFTSPLSTTRLRRSSDTANTVT